MENLVGADATAACRIAVLIASTNTDKSASSNANSTAVSEEFRTANHDRRQGCSASSQNHTFKHPQVARRDKYDMKAGRLGDKEPSSAEPAPIRANFLGLLQERPELGLAHVHAATQPSALRDVREKNAKVVKEGKERARQQRKAATTQEALRIAKAAESQRKFWPLRDLLVRTAAGLRALLKKDDAHELLVEQLKIRKHALQLYVNRNKINGKMETSALCERLVEHLSEIDVIPTEMQTLKEVMLEPALLPGPETEASVRVVAKNAATVLELVTRRALEQVEKEAVAVAATQKKLEKNREKLEKKHMGKADAYEKNFRRKLIAARKRAVSEAFAALKRIGKGALSNVRVATTIKPKRRLPPMATAEGPKGLRLKGQDAAQTPLSYSSPCRTFGKRRPATSPGNLLSPTDRPKTKTRPQASVSTPTSPMITTPRASSPQERDSPMQIETAVPSRLF